MKNKALKAANLLLPPIGSLISTWVAYRDWKNEVPQLESFGAQSGVKQQDFRKRLKGRFYIQSSAALAVWASTITAAVLMAKYPELLTMEYSSKISELKNLEEAFGIEKLDGMVIACALSFILLPIIIKSIASSLYANSVIQLKANSFSSGQELLLYSGNAGFWDLVSPVSSRNLKFGFFGDLEYEHSSQSGNVVSTRKKDQNEEDQAESSSRRFSYSQSDDNDT